MAAGVRYVILAEFQPYDPVGAAAVTLRASNVDSAAVCALNGVTWWPAIAAAPRRTLDLFDGDFGGGISAAIGEIEIALAAFPNAARYAWGERPVTLWRGEFGAAWGSYTQIFTGLTRPPRAGKGRMRLGLRVDDRWLDRPLLATYAGTGGVEGPADLKGTPKPLALGAPQFIEGVVVNRTLNIVQLHGYGAMNGVPTALDRLNRYGASAGNDANYAALAAATILPGTWRTCLAEGLVRFGAPPGGVASFLAQGDSGSGLGWVRTPGQVIRRIALIAGATAGQIDTASLAALDTACPYNISLYIKDQTTARDVIQQIAASCNAAAGVSHLGKLCVTRAAIGTPALTLSAAGAALPPVAEVQMLEVSAPFWRTAVQAEPTFRVHGFGDFGGVDFADVGGVTKPDDNATSGENILINPELWPDGRGWNFTVGATRVDGNALDPAKGYARAVGPSAGSFLSQEYSTQGATRLYLSWSAIKNATWAPAAEYMSIYWFDRAGAYISFSAAYANGVGATIGTWNPNSVVLIPPANAYTFRVQWDWGAPGATGQCFVAKFRVSTTQRGADATAVNFALGLQAGGGVLQVGGVVAAAGLQSQDITVIDGQVLTWSLSRTPSYAFDISGLPALAAGESYFLALDGLSSTGATVRAKIRTTGGAPINLSSAAGTAITTGVLYKADKGDTRDARDNLYNFRVIGQFEKLYYVSATTSGGGGGGGIGGPVREP